jgi:hypothetical protein
LVFIALQLAVERLNGVGIGLKGTRCHRSPHDRAGAAVERFRLGSERPGQIGSDVRELVPARNDPQLVSPRHAQPHLVVQAVGGA